MRNMQSRTGMTGRLLPGVGMIAAGGEQEKDSLQHIRYVKDAGNEGSW